MSFLRALIAGRPLLLAGLLVGTLLLKLAVPFGYMPSVQNGTITLILCPGMVADTPEPAMAGMHHGSGDGGDHDRHGTPDQPCAFAGLNAPGLAAADAGLLIAALAFAFLRAIHATVAPSRLSATRLRPPLRAPPLTV